MPKSEKPSPPTCIGCPSLETSERYDFFHDKHPGPHPEYFCACLTALDPLGGDWIGFYPQRPAECPIRELTAEELAELEGSGVGGQGSGKEVDCARS